MSAPAFDIADLDEAVRIFLDPARHHELAGHVLDLPGWFDGDLDPDGDAFRAQQMRLWREVTQREVYDPANDEDTPEISQLDAILRPAFYATGDAAEAGRHLLAMGHILLRSGVHAGDRVIEYGAGFGQNALALARLGARVDTVDIAAGFCGAVAQQAERFQVDLTAHQQPFGYNPAGVPGAYRLILFYESFHHCLDYKQVIPALRDMLAPGGRILMAGEPIVREPNALMPYPWGIRLDWENVAIMRQRGWMELGFHEPYLVRQFAEAGMRWQLHPDPNDAKAVVYEFRRFDEPIALATQSLTVAEEAGWHDAEAEGRWTRGQASLGLPAHDGMVTVVGTNFHPRPCQLRVTLNGARRTLVVGALADFALALPAGGRAGRLEIASDSFPGGDHDPRSLGLFIRRVEPV